ncbi:MAG: zinc ribbon domain-containing protein [Nitrososphaerota archaeon]|nr:zinc ribbon domain-containing protein [Nitrososphaerota archaeon]
MSLSMMVVPQRVAAQTSSQYYERSFEWDYDGQHWTWNLSIPVALYDAYCAVPNSIRTKDGPAGYGYLTTTRDYYIRLLAQKLDDTATQMGYDDYAKASFVLAFAQSIPYTSDLETTGYDEYPRFPIETLVDYGGDCEDTVILFASLTLIMGYSVVYINPPNHYAAGILGDNWRGAGVTYPKDSNQTYYYCETTGTNFKIGQLPQEFTGQNMYIYAIDENRQFIPTIAMMPPTVHPSPTQSDMDSPIDPNLAIISPPAIPDPIAQPVLPLSFNLIVENPVLFAIIILAIAASMVATVISIRRPIRMSQASASPPLNTLSTESDQATEKFCIYCGADNKSYAAFCEKCGQPIS